MKLELQKTYPGDKDLLIIDTEGHLRITIDYDDVDHETVIRDALALIEKVNGSCNKTTPIFLTNERHAKDR